MPRVLLDRQDRLDRLGDPKQVHKDQQSGARVAEPEDQLLVIPLDESPGDRDRRDQENQDQDDPGGHQEPLGEPPEQPEALLAGGRH